MKKTTVFLMLFLRVYLLAAQHEKVTLSGYVRDASSGEELLGASVLIKETDEGAVTNLYGFYSIHLLPGTYSLQFSYMGHETKSVEIVLRSEEHTSNSSHVRISYAVFCL